MKITPEANISSLVLKKLLISVAPPQRSLTFGALKFAKLPCPFVFLAKALILPHTLCSRLILSIRVLFWHQRSYSTG